jgi:hypothetical protein
MDRFTWGIVAGALALVVVGLASVTLLQRPAPPPNLSTPEGVVRAYMVAMADGRFEDGWDLLATTARTNVTRDEFIRRATESRTPRERAGRALIERVEIDGSVARVDVARILESGGLFVPSTYTDRTTVRLERERGDWRITVPPETYLIAQRPI